MNLTNENHNYFNYNLLSKAHPGAVFVNIARGEHSALAGLHKLLKEKHLGGVGLDVYENEGTLAVALRNGDVAGNDQIAIAREMLTYPNVIMTPHNAFNTIEAVERKVQMSIDQILYFLKHKNFEWAIKQ
jgi:D-lactate dehydrogenase